MVKINKGMSVPLAPVDWASCRKAYVERTPKPTYIELSKEFNCSAAAVSTKAREELWPVERQSRVELALAKSEAGEIVLRSIENEGPILQQSRQQVASFLSAIEIAMQKIVADAETTKGSTMAASLNTVSFALSNIGKFMDSAGLVGVGKAFKGLKAEAQREGQEWSKGTMQQINVTVNGMVAALKAEDQAKPAEPAENLANVKPVNAESEPTDGEAW